MTRAGQALVATLLVLLGSVAVASPAQAHVSLVGSTPAAGASLISAPAKVTLRYDENVRDPSVVIVRGPDGKRVDSGGTTVVDNTASVAVSVRQAGGYRIAYRVISADGHPVTGTLGFSFHGKDAVPAGPTTTAARREGPGSQSARIVVAVLLLVVLVGGGLLLARRASTSQAPRDPAP